MSTLFFEVNLRMKRVHRSHFGYTMCKINLPTHLVLLLATALSLHAQDPKAAIEQKLESEYKLTQPTADESDIVTAGSVLVLQRGHGDNNIMMAPVSSTNFYQNTYEDGKITQNAHR